MKYFITTIFLILAIVKAYTELFNNTELTPLQTVLLVVTILLLKTVCLLMLFKSLDKLKLV